MEYLSGLTSSDKLMQQVKNNKEMFEKKYPNLNDYAKHMIETLLFSTLGGSKVYLLQQGGKKWMDVIISAEKIHFFTAPDMILDFQIELGDIDCAVIHKNNHELLALHQRTDQPDLILSFGNLRTNFLVSLMTAFENSDLKRF